MSKDLYNVDYLKFLCKKYKLVPSSRYGQNFLINPEVIEKIIETAEIKKTDTVVEVGPGFGVLTLPLAEQAGKVVAFEIEKKLQPYWIERLKIERLKNLDIVWGNVLVSFRAKREISTHSSATPRLSFETLRGPQTLEGGGVGVGEVTAWPTVGQPTPGLGAFPARAGNTGAPLGMTGAEKSYKVVANLPYQITSNVIRKFLEAENKPESMTLMVQKEVGERICAGPGEMSLLSVSVQYYAEPEIIALVKKNNFWPEPKVDSAIIKLKVYSKLSATPRLGGVGVGEVTAWPTVGQPTPGLEAFPAQAGNKGESLGMTDGQPTPTPPKRGSETCDDNHFFRVVKAGFAQKRKLLSKNLIGVFDKAKVRATFDALGLDEKVRAQELSVEEWKKIASSLCSSQ